MYLSEIQLWNFRKFGSIKIDGEKSAGISIRFNNGLNVLIGENDSGKTAIVDAIRLVLGTQSRDWFHIDEYDFHHNGTNRASFFNIKCIFKGFTVKEAAPFLEWIDIIEIDGTPQFSLTINYTAERAKDKINRELRAGSDLDGILIPTSVQDLLRVIYLKPLRDAETELTPGKRSRLAQILKAHPAFQKDDDSQPHELETIVSDANKQVEDHFTDGKNVEAASILKTINNYLSHFFPPSSQHNSNISISGSSLNDILHRLSLAYDSEPAGLGSLNILYIAAELLLMQTVKNYSLRLTIIEEIEAHLHPQAQLRLIKYLENEKFGQIILTTHSTTLASSIKLDNLIICKDGDAFPMGSEYTNLEKKNYDFLERFLDATKANLFFAKGVILVEGDAENILLPTISSIIGAPLYAHGVSIVNVGSTAFLHYAKIFDRKDKKRMGINVSIVTDLDIKPLELQEEKSPEDIEKEKVEKHKSIRERFNFGDIATFVSPNWTLEYEISLSKFRMIFLKSVLLSEKIENSKTGDVAPKKVTEAENNAISLLAEWGKALSKDPRSKEKIAKIIYNDRMLLNGTSKAIVSQHFSQRLSHHSKKDIKNIMPSLIKNNLKYLCDAIYHAARIQGD